VPGSYSSLEKERIGGKSVKMVYSTIDALTLAKKNPAKEVVFLGVGFETTAPTVAQSILIVKANGIKNYSVLCGHKTMPEALAVLAADREAAIDAFLLPGHVSAVIGIKPYEFLSRRYGKRCVIAGFEPLDIIKGIFMIISQVVPKVDIEYSRIVNKAGNALARRSIYTVFEKCSSDWRGIGNVKDSGLKIKKEFSDFDAELKFKLTPPRPRENKNCMCGNVLKGVMAPTDCKLFGKACNPDAPVGTCMVSSEGACSAYYKYADYRRCRETI
jgi:hydrogenase expression/formation protein HypD